MIVPGQIPQITGDLDVVEAQGRALRAQGGKVSTTGADIDSAWQGLSAFYRAPEAADLFAATGPVRSTAAFIGSDLGAVGDALTAYAAEARSIQARLQSLQWRAQSFVDSVAGDDDWRKDGDKVNTNNRLLQQVDAAVADWMAAQRACANRIGALYGGIQYRQDDGKGKPGVDEYGYSAKQLDGAANSDDGLPWGKPDKRDKPWYEDAWDDVCSFGKGLVIDGLWGTVKGLGNLVGFGGWDNFKNSWVGLEKLGLALTPGMLSLNQVIALPGLKRGELSNTLLVTGKALVSWDEWGKDPARAAGSTLFNVLAAVGTDGAGAAVEGIGDAGKVADAVRVGEIADDAGLAGKAAGYVGKGLSGLDDLQHAITGLPRVQDIAAAVGAKIPDIKVPAMSAVDAGAHDAGAAVDAGRAGDAGHVAGEGGHTGGTTTHPGAVEHQGGAGHLPSQSHGGSAPGDASPSHSAPGDGAAPNDNAAGGHPGGEPPRTVVLADGAQHTVSYSNAQLTALPASHPGLLEALARDHISVPEFHEMVNAPYSELSPSDVAVLNKIRDAVPPIGPDEVLQKALNAHDGDSLITHAVRYPEDSVRGYVSRASDMVDVLTPADQKEALALSYDARHDFGQPAHQAFPDDAEYSYSLRFKTDGGSTPDVPRGPAFGGDIHDGPPFTGNGFTASSRHLIPEYRFSDPATMRPGAELWRIRSDGTESIAAVLDPAGRWVEVE